MKEEIKRPLIGLGIILIKEGKEVLMGQRKGAHGAGTWSFPGGHLEWMEKLVTCADREMLEETGLSTSSSNYEFLDTNSCAVTNNFFTKEARHDITLYLRAKYLAGEPRVMEPDKCERWGWYRWEKLPELNLFIPVQNLIEQRYNPFN